MTRMPRCFVRRTTAFGLFAVLCLVMFYSFYWSHQTTDHQPLAISECSPPDQCISKLAPLFDRQTSTAALLVSAKKEPAQPSSQSPLTLRRVLSSGIFEERSKPDRKSESNLIYDREREEAVLVTNKPVDLSLTSTLSGDAAVKNVDLSNCSGSDECGAPLLRSDGFVRHCITNAVIGKLPRHTKTSRVRFMRGKFAESAPVRRRSFKKVFDSRAWGHSWDSQFRGLNASGMGATLNWAQETIAALHVVIDQLKQRYKLPRVRLLDVPCGDMAWMSRFLQTRTDVDYTGIDIVPDLIDNHRRVFAAQPWRFHLSDIVRDGINTSANQGYDLILCRTLLQHLYFADVQRVLGQMSVAGGEDNANRPVYLFTTTFAAHPANKELVIDSDNPGRFRRLNLEIPPLSLEPPLCVTRDGPPDAYDGWNHFIGLWRLPLRRVADCWRSSSVAVGGIPQKLFSCVDWSLPAD